MGAYLRTALRASEAGRMVAALPQAQLAVLAYSAHLSPVEEPAALTALIRHFLNTLT